jgi:REP element-mobilizing transposase RayT
MRSRDRNTYDTVSEVHFVTSTVAGFVPLFTHEETCQVFVDCLRFYQSRGDFTLLAWVLMPNHFHLVLKRSPAKFISDIIGNLKRFTSRQVRETLARMQMNDVLAKLREAALQEPASDTALWKHRFDSLVITSPDTLRQKTEYIHHNPVRKGLVGAPALWKYSSSSNYQGGNLAGLEVDVEWICIGYGGIPSGRDS